MGVTFANDTIIVTGGSQDDPYTMADLDADGTVGTYITPGGYGNKEYAVSKDLVIGSTDADTFFDPTRTIVKMADGYTLTVYSHALRGGRLRDSWTARTFGAESGPIDEQDCKRCTEKMMYQRLEAVVCPETGDIIAANNPVPAEHPTALGEPFPIETPPESPQQPETNDPIYGFLGKSGKRLTNLGFSGVLAGFANTNLRAGDPSMKLRIWAVGLSVCGSVAIWPKNSISDEPPLMFPMYPVPGLSEDVYVGIFESPASVLRMGELAAGSYMIHLRVYQQGGTIWWPWRPV